MTPECAIQRLQEQLQAQLRALLRLARVDDEWFFSHDTLEPRGIHACVHPPSP